MLNKVKFSAVLVVITIAFAAFTVGSQFGSNFFAAAADAMKPLLVSIVGTPDVTVVNNATNPVPVNVGTPNVTVVNNASNPVPVNDTSNFAKVPLAQETDFVIPVGEFTGVADIFAVPDGTRYVITCISAFINVPVGQKALVSLDLFTNGTSVKYTLVLENQGTFGAGEVLVGNLVLEVNADAGTSVALAARRNNGAGLLIANVAVSGYLVTLP